jgi:hypothetical protein
MLFYTFSSKFTDSNILIVAVTVYDGISQYCFHVLLTFSTPTHLSPLVFQRYDTDDNVETYEDDAIKTQGKFVLQRPHEDHKIRLWL